MAATQTLVIPVILLGGLVYSLYSSGSKVFREGKLVETQSGAVRGIISMSRDGREFYEWLKIPFAMPPVGRLRFASPQPIGKWNGVLDGSKHGPSCAQNSAFSRNLVSGEEDCLFLNIAVPKLNNWNYKLPVLVYIPGGGYTSGDSSSGRLAYKIANIGFLSTGDRAIRGNMGLKDQVQALKWIQENIHNFGGNPNQVTIFGHSAGGASTHQLLLSPMTRGLFQRAISQSGVALNTWGFKSPAKSIEKTKSIAKALKCPIYDSEELANCLRSKSARELLETAWIDSHRRFSSRPNKFGEAAVPTIELVDDEEAFLTQHPLEVVAQGKAHRVPWMVGHTADEGLFFTAELEGDKKALPALERNWEIFLKSAFYLDSSNQFTSNEKASKIRDFYFRPSQRLPLRTEPKLKTYTKIFSDALYNLDIHEAILYQKPFSPVYPYFFNKRDGPGLGDIYRFPYSIISSTARVAKSVLGQSYFGKEPLQENDGGVNHAVDSVYLFGFSPVIQIPKSSKYYGFSKTYVKLIVDFATNDLQYLTFRGLNFPATPREGPLRFFEITNDVPRLISEPFEDRMQFLRNLQIRNSSF